MGSAIEKGSLCQFALVGREGKNTGVRNFETTIGGKERRESFYGPSMIPS